MAVKATSPNHWTTREFPPVKDLKMGDSPGLSVWTQCNHKCPYKEEAEGQRRYDSKSRGQSNGVDGRGPLETGKGKEMNSTLEPLEGRKLCLPILDF